jgi:endonuclease/exonuclease/phosphatase family metal-dependent hydrolase
MRVWTGCLLIALAGCMEEPDRDDMPQRHLDRRPEITVDNSTGVASMEISVLIYNVAGLPWPLGCGKQSRTTDENGERIPIACDRSEAQRDIGDALATMREMETEPDVIMLQEAFIEDSEEIPIRGGYLNWVTGPTSTDLGPKVSERASSAFIAERSFWKGEKLGKWQSSGLLTAADYPIHVRYSHPFNQWECAGFDCLANKGILTVELDIPGLPDPLAIATTHYNSRGASGVTGERSLAAHKLQVDETNEYFVSLQRRYLPFIWGGDLNMRQATDRFEYFVERASEQGNGFGEVSEFCSRNRESCEVQIQWKSDAPWYETQTLQGWSRGDRVEIQPLQMQELFDAPVDGVMPSDHNGLLVRYRLSWPAVLTRPF